jgi:hypothetical protein
LSKSPKEQKKSQKKNIWTKNKEIFAYVQNLVNSARPYSLNEQGILRKYGRILLNIRAHKSAFFSKNGINPFYFMAAEGFCMQASESINLHKIIE